MKKHIVALIVGLYLLVGTGSSANANDLTYQVIYVDGQKIATQASSLEQFQGQDVKGIAWVNEWTNQLIDYTNGYQFTYPSTMKVDLTFGDIRTVLRNEECQIEIYRQPLDSISFATYRNYSNGFLSNTQDHLGQSLKKITLNDYTAYQTQWYRKPLSRVENDLNYYLTIDIKGNDNEAYSIFIKANRDISADSQYMQVVRSFVLREKHGQSYVGNVYQTIQEEQSRMESLSQESKDLLQKYFATEKELTWGIYEPTAPEYLWKLEGMERQLKYRFDFIVYYQHLPGAYELEELMNHLQMAYDNKRIVEVSLQTTKQENGNGVYDILDGKYDAFLHEYAKELADFGHPVLLRLGNEMNGDWCVYSAYHTSKDTDIYKAFYRYLFDIFQQHGANNVIWVWNPNEKSFPDFKWNNEMMYYPGNEYVDIIGMTGYNTGTYYEGESWRSFGEIYQPLYEQMMARFSQPFMITEFASSSIGGDKIAWVEDMFESIQAYPRIKVAIWWSGADWDIKGEIPSRIYYLNENNDILEAFRQGFQKS